MSKRTRAKVVKLFDALKAAVDSGPACHRCPHAQRTILLDKVDYFPGYKTIGVATGCKLADREVCRPDEPVGAPDWCPLTPTREADGK